MPAATIETLEDWNQRLACCCQMPLCPVPVVQCKRLGFSVSVAGFKNPDDHGAWKRYQTNMLVDSSVGGWSRSYPDGGSNSGGGSFSRGFGYTYSQLYEIGGSDECGNSIATLTEACTHTGSSWWTTTYADDQPDSHEDLTILDKSTDENPCSFWLRTVNHHGELTIDPETGNSTGWHVVYPDPTEELATSLGYYPGAESGDVTDIIGTDTYEDAITASEWFTAAKGKIANLLAAASEECWDHGGTGCISACTKTTPETNDDEPILSLTYVKFRFQIPRGSAEDPWKGSYFKITYQTVTEFADATTDSLSDDITITWAGPGNPANADDASWFTDWITLDPPDATATKRIVNIRFECYRTPQWGNKPQVTGEGYEPTA